MQSKRMAKANKNRYQYTEFVLIIIHDHRLVLTLELWLFFCSAGKWHPVLFRQVDSSHFLALQS